MVLKIRILFFPKHTKDGKGLTFILKNKKNTQTPRTPRPRVWGGAQVLNTTGRGVRGDTAFDFFPEARKPLFK